jgi:hypothetical protein
MSGLDRRFDPAELRDPEGTPIDDAEAAAILAMARDLEAFAGTQVGAPSADFEDRVMAAVALEAPPRPVAAGGFLAGLLLMVRDAWRITWSGDRPMAVRAQALGLVLLVLLAVGSTGTLAAVGVSRLLDGDRATGPTLEPSPVTPTPSLLPTSGPSASPTPTLTPGPSPTPSSEPSDTPEPSETSEATDDHGGSGGTEQPAASAKPTTKPTKTPRPSETPDAEDTPEPDDTPHPSETPEPDDTPSPSPSPKATTTPHSNGAS